MQVPTYEEVIFQDIDFLRKCPYGLECKTCPEKICVKFISIADFPTDYGHFKILGFTNNKDGKDHIIVLKGEIGDGEEILTRIHSKCLTGDSLGSRRCDCGPQLHKALGVIENEGRGIVLYHQAEGRGIGLLNKIRAYQLQDHEIDTFDANVLLGFEPDERDYSIPAAMLKKLGIKSVKLMTNNKEKIFGIESNGIRVIERLQHELSPHEDNIEYLSTKKEKFGHLLKLDHHEE